MTDATTVMASLDGYSLEMDALSKGLAEVERQLEPVEERYEKFLDDFECAAWDRHDKDGAKLPSEAMRLRLARREMSSELLGEHTALIARRKRMEKRIASLRSQVSAQQSILSALKVEAEASGAGLRRAA